MISLFVRYVRRWNIFFYCDTLHVLDILLIIVMVHSYVEVYSCEYFQYFCLLSSPARLLYLMITYINYLICIFLNAIIKCQKKFRLIQNRVSLSIIIVRSFCTHSSAAVIIIGTCQSCGLFLRIRKQIIRAAGIDRSIIPA
jgi:hypothetical protein